MDAEQKKAWEECVDRVKRSCKLGLLPKDNVYALVLAMDSAVVGQFGLPQGRG